MSSVPAPTLAPAIQNQFFELLQSNGNCELPCFVGITPGKTLWSDANSILQPFVTHKPIGYDETRSTPNKKTFYVQIQTKMNQDISVELKMNVALDVDQNNIVQHIVIRIELYGNGFTEFNDKHLSKYGLREVFLRNGIPDTVHYSHQLGGYNFGVVYKILKMAIVFAGNAKQSDDVEGDVCPNMGDGQVSSMIIALAAPSDSIDLTTLVGYPFDDDPTLEESAGLSLDNFYQLIIADQQPACFTPKTLP